MPYVEYSSCIRSVSKVFLATAIHQNSANAQNLHYKDERTTISRELQRKQGHKVNWVILQHICVPTPTEVQFLRAAVKLLWWPNTLITHFMFPFLIQGNICNLGITTPKGWLILGLNPLYTRSLTFGWWPPLDRLTCLLALFMRCSIWINIIDIFLIACCLLIYVLQQSLTLPRSRWIHNDTLIPHSWTPFK